MLTINPNTFLIYALIASPIVLLIVAYFTRAGLRRFVGALAGGFAYAALNIAWDIVGYYTGWWHYPFTTASYAPLLFYVAEAFSYGAAIALIGWRVNRRFGIRGLVVFLIIFTAYGATHDYGGAALTHNTLTIFGAGVAPVIADALCYGTNATLAQVVMRLIAGPAQADQLARLPKQDKKIERESQ